MRRIIFFAFLFIFFLLDMQVAANSIDVCKTCQFKNLEEALDKVKNFDTIRIHEGEYKMVKTDIDKSITILGINYPHIISFAGDEIFNISANHVRLVGLKLSGVKTSYLKDNAAIRINNSKHFLLQANILEDNFFGIYLEHGSKGTVKDNTIRSNAKEEASSGNAIHAWYCKDLIIENNTLLGHRDGIYLEFVENSIISNNHSKENLRYGLHFMFSNNDEYTQNIFENNGAGVAVMFSKNIKMEDNTFLHNWGPASYGLLLKEIYDADILNNRFIKNTIAIFVEGSTRINYLSNEFEQNGWAVKMTGGCLDNNFKYNNFIQNTFNFTAPSSFNNNIIEKNYWSDHNSYDLDRDGVADTPYRPVKLFSYISQKSEESIILLRSLFVEILNFAEKITPIFTPEEVQDKKPMMFPYGANSR